MHIEGLKVKYCAVLLGCFMALMAPCASSFAAEKSFHKAVKVSGKPTAPIDISYAVPESVAIGASVNVVVTISVRSDVTDLGVKITAGEGLSLSGGLLVKSYGTQNSDAVLSETITVTPNARGILYLNVFTSGVFQGKSMIHASAIPVSVGTSPERMLKKSGTVQRDSSGRNIVILPAQEGRK